MKYTILENTRIAPNIFRLRLAGDASMWRPGQFAQVSVPGFFLRRPISVCDWDEGETTLIFRAGGDGTKALSALTGETDLLPGLGNGYDLDALGERPLLVGGGVGVPPLYGLARRLIEKGARVIAALGFKTAADVLLAEEMTRLGVQVRIATEDGSAGEKGFVTALLDGDHTAFAACGPEVMMKAVAQKLDLPGQLSFEERMACGFGACMGCARQMKSGMKRVCADGPVFDKEDVIWPI